MISVKQDFEIRSLLHEKMPDREIARLTGVSIPGVSYLRRMYKIISELSEETKGEIKWLLINKIPPGAIEIRTKVPRNAILMLRRMFGIRRKRNMSDCNVCPTCGRETTIKITTGVNCEEKTN